MFCLEGGFREANKPKRDDLCHTIPANAFSLRG